MACMSIASWSSGKSPDRGTIKGGNQEGLAPGVGSFPTSRTFQRATRGASNSQNHLAKHFRKNYPERAT